jgi:hypothetical protein
MVVFLRRMPTEYHAIGHDRLLPNIYKLHNDLLTSFYVTGKAILVTGHEAP